MFFRKTRGVKLFAIFEIRMGLEFVLFGEVFDLVVGVGNDGSFAGLPSSRADLAVLVDVLEGLHESEGFINIT